MSLKKETKKKKKEKDRKRKKGQAETNRAIAYHYRMAEWAKYVGDNQKLVPHLKKILKIKPNSRTALKWMGEVCYNQDNYVEAACYFERLKKEGDDWNLLELYLGVSYFLGRINNDLALENLSRFLEKTKKKRTKGILEKRQSALFFINSIQEVKNRKPESVQKIVKEGDQDTGGHARTRPSREPSAVKSSPGTTKTPLINVQDYQIGTVFSFSPFKGILQRVKENKIEDKSIYDSRLEFYHLNLLRGYDELLCLETLQNVNNYWYQIETVKRVLKYYRGRALLADEVGLGKTIEACMIIKEYLLRGLIKRVLILTPSSLVSQWHEEMSSKFGLDFTTTDHADFRQSESFWAEHPLIIASINVAKSKRNFEKIIQIEHDMVVVDEAHHMRNRSTLNWKLVNALIKKFILLISATPVQNNLIELFNLITLLKPGFLKTEKEFRTKYMVARKPKVPKNSEQLRELLKEVMIRNTRSLIDVKLPPRFATTIMVAPSHLETEIYNRVSSVVRDGYKEKRLDQFSLYNLQMRAGSSFFSLEELLVRILEKNDAFKERITEILHLLSTLKTSEKEQGLLELIRKKPGEKKIIFTHYQTTMKYLAEIMTKEGIPFTQFRGNMSNAEKDLSIQDFRESKEVLLSTEVGGEGRNIQFCCTIINYDLPWNPMRIEQRIGRIHRIGQTKDVFIFNFCLKDSIEEYILDILDKKINMFELVIGEIDNIVGNLDEETEFSDLIMNIWVNSKDKKDLEMNFGNLGEKLIQAKKDYLESKKLDESLLATHFEV